MYSCWIIKSMWLFLFNTGAVLSEAKKAELREKARRISASFAKKKVPTSHKTANKSLWSSEATEKLISSLGRISVRGYGAIHRGLINLILWDWDQGGLSFATWTGIGIIGLV